MAISPVQKEIQDKTDAITTYHWLLFTICFFGTVFAGTASTFMSVYLPVAVKDLLGDKSPDELNNISAYINAIFISFCLFLPEKQRVSGRSPERYQLL